VHRTVWTSGRVPALSSADRSEFVIAGHQGVHARLSTGYARQSCDALTSTSGLIGTKESAAKVRDIVGLYVDPPAHAVVLSVDEKSQIQALDRTQPAYP
jgi:hypothetical protein